MNAAASLETRLAAFIGAQEPGAANVVITNVTPVSGGNARRAFAFDAAWDVAGKHTALPCIMLAKAEPGQLETDLETEFRVLRALQDSDVPAPPALWIDTTGDSLGCPTLIMERIAGTSNIKALLAAEPAAANRAIAEDLAAAAGKLHTLAWRGKNLGNLETPSPETVAGEQVVYWENLFLKNRMEPLPAMVAAFHWLKTHAPKAERIVLLHGDFRFGNFLYEGAKITALLDWEMAHLGDPMEDLAWAYRPLWSPARHMTLEDFAARYTQHSGIPAPAANLRFYRLFSEIKHAVISLNAARAFADGKANSLRMSDRMTMLPGLLKNFQDGVRA
ncbi:MAG: phosphotransferase family protein [Rhodospirillaceae bacterium]|nr:phosphotransferase family protein [Rhodospirillaceae bacterium]